MRRLVLATLGALVVAGCGPIGELIDPGPIAPLEVWNRTLEPISVEDLDGRRIDVPACGHAEFQLMRLDHLIVRNETGRSIGGFGTRPNQDPQFLVFVAAPGVPDLTSIRPVDLPPCEGRDVLPEG